jgi:MFS family permease
MIPDQHGDRGEGRHVSTSTAGTGTAAPALSTRRRWTILVVCAFALFLVGLDTTIVTVGLGEIGRGLAVVPGRIAWVVDAYTVPFASLLVTSGSIADRFGRRRVFRAGLVVFALASLACSAAPSLGVLVAMRAVQGVRASMLTPVALAIVVNAMPDPRERAQAIGVWGAMFGLSMAAGPVTGGALLAVFDWRALFWINAPVVALALLFTVWFVPESRAAARRRIDVPGQMLLILTLAAGVAVLIEGPRVGWTAPPVLLAGAVLLLAAVVFIAVETRRHEPLLDPGLFRVPSFAAAITGAIAVFVAFSMTLLLTTSLLQDGEGWTALAAGAATLPMAAAATICAPDRCPTTSAGRERLPLGWRPPAHLPRRRGRPGAAADRIYGDRRGCGVCERPDHEHGRERAAARAGRGRERYRLDRAAGGHGDRHRACRGPHRCGTGVRSARRRHAAGLARGRRVRPGPAGVRGGRPRPPPAVAPG